MTIPLKLTPTDVRRLAIYAQRLYISPATTTHTPDDMAALVRQLRCLQLDPISTVARSHHLVLYSRLGNYDLATFDRLLYTERRLFEYWAHAASIVLTEDYPIHAAMMRDYGTGDGRWATDTREWLERHAALREHVLTLLRERGPMPSRLFEDNTRDGWQWAGWSNGRTIPRMLDTLWTRGEIMVAGRTGGQKLWDLTERVLPPDTPREPLAGEALTRAAAVHAIRALGVAKPQHIKQHFTRYRYPELPHALKTLVADETLVPVEIVDHDGERGWTGTWYMHADDAPLIAALRANPAGRTVLLAPFDNLIADRTRTTLIWNFNFRLEFYVPKEKRRWGYYVLSLLHHERLIGRIDMSYERGTHTLHAHRVYAEKDAPNDAATGAAAAAAIADLAAYLGAAHIAVADISVTPSEWRAALRAL